MCNNRKHGNEQQQHHRRIDERRGRVVSRVRCGFCSRNVHESITALVPGQAAGNYRRQARSRLRRVCRDCVVTRVEFVRKSQSEGRQTPLDESRISWSRAAAELSIDVSDLWRSDYDRKRRAALAGLDSCPGFRLDYYTDETVRDRPEHRYCECGWTEAHHVEEENR